MSFDDLGLSPELLRAVAREGYTVPTPVQEQAIPLVLAGRDVLAGAQTGTGKTAAFVLPLLQRLHARRPDGPRRVRALILTPTRELALQVEASVRTYGAERPIRSVAIYGGVGFEPQVRALRSGPEIVVATPGRLLDHAGQRTIDLSSVEILVLDEADRMLDMGFIRDIRKVLALLPDRRQNLLFSATFSNDIRSLAAGLLHEPASVQVTPRNTASELVEQVVYHVDRERKRELLSHLVKTGVIYQALVFTRTKHGANRLAQQLERDGIPATAIHGNKSQPQRVRALADFKANRYAILVATEVAARGLDIDALPHVVNFELPMVPEDYVHRIGRTGRAGVDGEAISLVCVDEAKLLRDIEAILGRSIPTATVPGFEPDPRIRPEPIRRGGLGTVRPAGAPRVSPRGPRERSIGHPTSQPALAPRFRHGQAARPGQGQAPRHGQGPAPRHAQGHAPQHGQGQGSRHGSGPRPVTRPGQSPATRPAPGQAPHRSDATRPAPIPRHGQASRHGQRPRHGQGARPQPPAWRGPRPVGPRDGRQHAPTTLPGERLARRPERAAD